MIRPVLARAAGLPPWAAVRRRLVVGVLLTRAVGAERIEARLMGRLLDTAIPTVRDGNAATTRAP